MEVFGECPHWHAKRLQDFIDVAAASCSDFSSLARELLRIEETRIIRLLCLRTLRLSNLAANVNTRARIASAFELFEQPIDVVLPIQR